MDVALRNAYGTVSSDFRQSECVAAALAEVRKRRVPQAIGLKGFDLGILKSERMLDFREAVAF
jgi:hypothetical protein